MLRELAVVNPRKKKRSKSTKVHTKRSKVRARRNPRGMSLGGSLRKVQGVVKPLVPAAIGGASALGVDYLIDKIPWPESWRARLSSGLPRTLVRAALAIGAGVALRSVVKKETAHQITAGALTVIAYDELKKLAAQMGGGALNEYRYRAGDLSEYRYLSGYNALPAVKAIRGGGNGMGAYVQARNNGMMPVTQ